MIEVNVKGSPKLEVNFESKIVKIEGGGIVDSALSLESENPVMNKILTARFNGIDTRIDSLPTKLSQFTDDVVAGKYLPLSGGTISGGVLEIDSSPGAYSFLRFKDRRINSAGYADNILKIIDTDGNAHGTFGLYGDSNGVLYYYLGCENDSYQGNNLRIYADKVSFGGSTILHSGNIGDYNAGSADVLAKTYAENINYAAHTTKLKLIAYNANWEANGFPANWTSGLSVMAGYVGWQLVVSGGSSDVPYFRKVSDSGVWSNWRALAFTDSNVASATKLQTPRTIWGQSFDGTENVSGNIFLGQKIIQGGTTALPRNMIDCEYESALVLGYGIRNDGTMAYYAQKHVFRIGDTDTLTINSSGNVTIGNSDLAGTDTKLYVNGDVKIGALRSTNKDFIIYGYDGTNFINAIDVDCNGSNLWIGYGSAPKSYNTNIAGNNIYLRYGSSRSYGLILNSSGNVTIGASDLAGTDAKLYVAGSKLSLRLTTATEMYLYAENSLARTGILISSTGKSGLYDYNNDKWIIGSEGTTKTWLGNGNVGIGTTSPAYKLDVSGDAHISGNLIVDGTITPSSASASYSLRGGTSNKTVVIIEVGSTEETIEHGLGADVAVSLYARDTTKEDSWVLTSNGDIEITDTAVIVTFDNPTIVEYKVVIVG